MGNWDKRGRGWTGQLLGSALLKETSPSQALSLAAFLRCHPPHPWKSCRQPLLAPLLTPSAPALFHCFLSLPYFILVSHFSLPSLYLLLLASNIYLLSSCCVLGIVWGSKMCKTHASPGGAHRPKRHHPLWSSHFKTSEQVISHPLPPETQRSSRDYSHFLGKETEAQR